MDGYNKPLRKDVSSTSGGLLVYIKKGIAAKPMKLKASDDLQVMAISLHLKSSKWLLITLYRPEHMKIPAIMDCLEDTVVANSKSYSNIIILGDFNMKDDNPHLVQFADNHNLYNLIKAPTCFKSRSNPSAIDHLFTNRKYSFIESHTVETGLSDHHKMIFTCMKSTYSKIPPKVLTYRDFKNFDENAFLSDVLAKLSQIPVLKYNMLNQVSVNMLNIPIG